MPSSDAPPAPRVPTWRLAIPGALTVAVGLCGVASIVAAVAMPSDAEKMLFSGGLVLLAALLDALDGPLARALRATTKIGRILDAISDAIAFGVAPIVQLTILSQAVADVVIPVWSTAPFAGLFGSQVAETSDSSAYFALAPPPAWLVGGISVTHGLAMTFRLAWAATADANRRGLPAPGAGVTVAATVLAVGYCAALNAVAEAVSEMAGTVLAAAIFVFPLAVVWNAVAMLSAWTYPRPSSTRPISFAIFLVGLLVAFVFEPGLVPYLPAFCILFTAGVPATRGLMSLATSRPSASADTPGEA